MSPTPPDHVALRKLFIRLLVTIPISGTFCLVYPGTTWWMLAIHAALVANDFDRFTLLLHNLSHIPTVYGPFRRVGRYALAYLGLFFGQTPATYRAHHVGMHHREENGIDDVSSTLPFQRDSVLDFLRYFTSFVFGTVFLLPHYFWRRKRKDWALMTFFGELSGYAFFALCFWWQPVPALMVLGLPFAMSRLLMMAGNWAQHAFIDPAAPQDPYRSILTVLAPRYNRRCFNDGYHLTHHLHPVMAFDEIPKHFETVKADWGRRGALVFAGPDFVAVWWLLMWGRYRSLARCYVPIDGVTRSEDEIIEMLKARLVPIRTVAAERATADA